MSKLEQLIEELCPNGVKYTSLGELGKFYGGLTGKSKDDFNKNFTPLTIFYKKLMRLNKFEAFSNCNHANNERD